jgi:hypothetical protein
MEAPFREKTYFIFLNLYSGRSLNVVVGIKEF